MKLEGTKEHLSTKRGVFTRIRLPDGYTITFVGPCGKAEGIRQAEVHRTKGTPSEKPARTS